MALIHYTVHTAFLTALLSGFNHKMVLKISGINLNCLGISFVRKQILDKSNA